MTDENKPKEPTKEEQEAKAKEDMRQVQLQVLQSKPLRDLYIAYSGKDTQHYGERGKQATQNNYINALQNVDSHVGKILANELLQNANSAQEEGLDLYESAASFVPAKLLSNAAMMYQSALTKVKVSDVTEFLGIKNIHEENISKNEQNMYVEDFMKVKKEYAGMILSSYLNTVSERGIAEALINQNQAHLKGLEKMLQTAPKKEEKKAEPKKEEKQ